jgi:hypothetical protein
MQALANMDPQTTHKPAVSDSMLLPQPTGAQSRPRSVMTTHTTATATDKSGDTWKRSVNEDNCWEHLILTLDGGGIRGYSSLLILQQLMREVAECERRLQKEEGPVPGSTRQNFNEDDLLPCHYFDFMYGTSTGGLIAVMLARLRMTVPQCLEIYRRVGQDLFGHRRTSIPLATKYHHKPLEKAVKDIVRQYCKNHDNCDGDDWHPWETDKDQSGSMEASKTSDRSSTWSSTSTRPVERICQSICLTATHSGQIGEAYLLRSYDQRYDQKTFPPWAITYNEGADKLKIWQVTRATSAAPFYFDMLLADVRSEQIGCTSPHPPSPCSRVLLPGARFMRVCENGWRLQGTMTAPSNIRHPLCHSRRTHFPLFCGNQS